MQYATNMDPAHEAKLLDDIVRCGHGDIDIIEDENDHSPRVHSKKLNTSISLQAICDVWPIDQIAVEISSLFESAVKTEEHLVGLDTMLTDIISNGGNNA